MWLFFVENRSHKTQTGYHAQYVWARNKTEAEKAARVMCGDWKDCHIVKAIPIVERDKIIPSFEIIVDDSE